MKSICCIIIILYSPVLYAFPDQGQRTKTDNGVPFAYFGMYKSLYAGSSISLSVSCEPAAVNSTEKVEVKLGWVLRQTNCLEDYFGSDIYTDAALQLFYDCPMNGNDFSKVRYISFQQDIKECSSREQFEFQKLKFLSPSELSKIPIASQCLSNYKSEASNTSAFQQLLSNSQRHSRASKSINLSDDHSSRQKKRRKRDLDQNESAFDNPEVNKNSKNKFAMPDHMKKTSANDSKVSDKLLGFHKQGKKLGSLLANSDVDGIYLFILKIESLKSELINITVDITMKGDYGYLSAADYPLLLFYGIMCGVYAVYAFMWLYVSALQWRDLLRIQFWIGAVIFLGLIEKAVFYSEYQSINYTGYSVQGAVLLAEILSCMKRTLARMLVIIVSLGFGIVKPRLGPTLHRVVTVGIIYFVLSTIEGSLRVLKAKNDPSNQVLIASIPLAITDSAICWWIFSSLVKTIRTLRLRRNLVKLSLYHHFTNTLIFAVLASVAYMVWSIHSHKLVNCISDWKELWVDEAYWHLLFSLVLLVIMILWRPTNNNQRYAFTPLLDAVDDENEDDDENLSNEAFEGMKMRSARSHSSASPKHNDNKQDDDLKWVEENIPSSLTDVALPSLLDSDEEIMTANFERNKME